MVVRNIPTEHLVLSSPSLEDLSGINAFKIRNSHHLKKWESTGESDLEDDQKRLENWIKEVDEGKSARFVIRLKGDENIIGFCNFSQIFHGSFQACYLGYKIDHEYEGKGMMFEALQSAICYVFEELKLHRIMANYMPINKRSAKLLDRLGFVIEGYAKNYLLINHQWEDHVLTALSFEMWERQLKWRSNCCRWK